MNPSWAEALDARYAVGAAAALSALVLLVQLARKRERLRAKSSAANPSPLDDESDALKTRSHVQDHGDLVIFVYELLRTLAALILLGLCVYTTFGTGLDQTLAMWALDASVAYAALLGLLGLISRATVSRFLSRHVTFTLLAITACYAYRDIWPSTTYTSVPQDAAEGYLLWVKVSLAILAGVVIPLLQPYPYIPLDPKDPQALVNPEQTASILSFCFFTFLDSLVSKANRVSHLPMDEFPPLADYDYARNLITRSYKYLDRFTDGGRHRVGSLFWSLVFVFRASLVQQVLWLIGYSLGRASIPFGTQRLLRYLESDGRDQVYKPWVWLLLLLGGRILRTVSGQAYEYLSTGSLVRAEGIFTSLLFDHALRIRMKASTSAKESGADAANGSTDGDKGRKDHGDNLVGKMNSLITSDLSNITRGRDFLNLIVPVPLVFTMGVVFLYSILEWSSLVGLAVMFALVPIPTQLGSLVRSAQMQRMAATDARVKTITETMTLLKMIKQVGYELVVEKQIATKRDDELVLVWRVRLLRLVVGIITVLIPVLHVIITFAIYTAVMKRELSASIVFSASAGFELVRQQVYCVLGMLPDMISAKVSLDRMDDFLETSELLDRYTRDTAPNRTPTSNDVVGFKNVHFTWSATKSAPLADVTTQPFTLRIDGEVTFRVGVVNLITGGTASGKTSLLFALLGEMHSNFAGTDGWTSLPRNQGVALAVQEGWVENATIKENILFGSPYNKERYEKVVYQCALEKDLGLYAAGDDTEVGEKGLTLSGGQKARVTLARAVYSPASIVLLDDVFAALDVHTARWIVKNCLRGDLLCDRTVLLVTHNVALASSAAQYVVYVEGGRIKSHGPLSESIAADSTLAHAVEEEKEAKESEDAEIKLEKSAVATSSRVTPVASHGKLVAKEEVVEGHIGFASFKLFLATSGGSTPLLWWSGVLILVFLAQMAATWDSWYLGYWAQQYRTRPVSEVSVAFYLSTWAALVVSVFALRSVDFIYYTIGSLRASRAIHAELIGSVLRSTFRWLDVTPTSRILARATQDIQSVDEDLTVDVRSFVMVTISIIVTLTSILVFTPIFILPGALMLVCGWRLGSMYMKAQLSVKREQSNAKAPVIGVFSGAIAGLTSIRAYDAEDLIRKRSIESIDRYVLASRTFFNLNRWISTRAELLSAMFGFALGVYLVYGPTHISPSNSGFTLTVAVSFSEAIIDWIRAANYLEVEGNSLERIAGYIDIEHEDGPNEGGQPPAHWPSSGELRVEHLSASYSKGGPRVLDDVSFHIKSGERVGIVGRTGSGKSSLTLSLLRCIPTEGDVYYDGLSTASLNLDALRRQCTVIPQAPELMSGTLRSNIDMFGEHDDAELHAALRASGLYALSDDGAASTATRFSYEGTPSPHATSVAGSAGLTLDSLIESGGANLSQGQRQIVALARAMVRRSKVLILDEATSAIDYQTDAVIQGSLRKELPKDVTVLTVAHRLRTIMDSDRIMVLDAGRLVEFDSPAALLTMEHGYLRALVDESPDKDELRVMAAKRIV